MSLFRQSFLSFFPDVSFSSVLFTALVSSEIFYFPPTVLKGLILDRLSEKDAAAAAGEDAVSGGGVGGAGGAKASQEDPENYHLVFIDSKHSIGNCC